MSWPPGPTIKKQKNKKKQKQKQTSIHERKSIKAEVGQVETSTKI